MPIRNLPFLAAGALFLAGCAGSGGPGISAGAAARPKHAAWVRTELYFGAVPAAAWNDFLAARITPRFPAGFTVYDALGQWRDRRGEVHQALSRVLLVFHPPDAASAAAIEAIRSEFLAQFQQESVLRADAPAEVSF